MRSVLVVLSLLALIAQPAEAGQKSKAARQKKAAALKKAGAGKQKKVKPTGESSAHQGAGTLGGTRSTHQDGSHANLPRSEAVIARTGSGSSARTVTRKRAQPRSAAIATTHQRESTVVPTATTAMTHSFDSSAAVSPRRKTGRVKRWFAGLFLVAALAGGGYGWHAADMNTKVGNAWTAIEHVISDATHPGGGGGGGGGHTTPIPPVPDNPQPPFPDPGPPTPDNPNNQTPGPSGGSGHQTPHHPETDHRGG
jgi:hypothetical protein